MFIICSYSFEEQLEIHFVEVQPLGSYSFEEQLLGIYSLVSFVAEQS